MDANWKPRTKLGKLVLEGAINDIDDVFKAGIKIKEPEIVEKLLPDLKSEIIFIGGSPGKGGGSKRTPTRRTARMHRSGRRYKISAMVAVGSKGYLGVGIAQSLEHRTAIEKATENAKLNLIPVILGCGSWECGCGEPHSIPFVVEGKAGSVRIVLKPGPKGLGLCINDEAKKPLRLAGVQDIWSKSFGETRTRVNFILALYDAFKKLNRMKFEPVKKARKKKENAEEEEKDEKETKQKKEKKKKKEEKKSEE